MSPRCRSRWSANIVSVSGRQSVYSHSVGVFAGAVFVMFRLVLGSPEQLGAKSGANRKALDSLKRPALTPGPFHIRSTHITASLAECVDEQATKNAPQSRKRGNYLRRMPRSLPR